VKHAAHMLRLLYNPKVRSGGYMGSKLLTSNIMYHRREQQKNTARTET
jgi:hypothetical protein